MSQLESLEGLLGLILSALFLGLIIVIAAASRERPKRALREILAITRLRRAVGLAVEAGTRLHVSLGSGDLTGLPGSAALAGMAMLERSARATSISDCPPVVTTGNSLLTILAQDTLRSTYQSLGEENLYSPSNGRLSGLTPFAFSAGALPVIADEQVSANLFGGHFGVEVALLTDAAERSGSLTVGGTDSIPGQAVLFAVAQEPLIGEEVYAGAAYLGAGVIHTACLQVQDIFRWVLIATMLILAVAKLGGLL